jgi:hypothetical protein
VLIRGIGILLGCVPCFHRNFGWYPGIPFYYSLLPVFGRFWCVSPPGSSPPHRFVHIFRHFSPMEATFGAEVSTVPSQDQAPAAPGPSSTWISRDLFDPTGVFLQILPTPTLLKGRERLDSPV